MTEIDRFRAGTVYTDVQLRRGEAIFTAYEEAQQAAADAPASEVADIEPLVMTGLQVTGRRRLTRSRPSPTRCAAIPTWCLTSSPWTRRCSPRSPAWTDRPSSSGSTG
ncbi:hypothetical protein ACFQZC_38490 [Streptacidiphilus monticola]